MEKVLNVLRSIQGRMFFPSLQSSAPPRLPAGITGSAIWRIGMKKKVSWLFYIGSPVIGFTLGTAFAYVG